MTAPTLFFQFLFFLLPFVSSAFVHPGLLVTDVDINRIKTKLAAKKEPWLGSWNNLVGLKYSGAAYTDHAVPAVYRSSSHHPVNADRLWHDAAAAFNLALRWKISGDTQFADAAARVLVAWAKVLTTVGDNDDQFLVSGLQGHQLANAAELLRDYPPFATGGLALVQDMMTRVFLQLNMFFLEHRAGSEHNVRHFFANWELCNLASAMAIGVLTDNQTIFDFAVTYFKNGTGNGAIGNAITNIAAEPLTGKPLGQGQEAGRDQGHAGLDFQLLGVVGQQAYNQGEDLFAYANNRILLGAEYYARYNLGHDVPFEPYTNWIVHYTQISSASRGAIRPAWELLHNHYGMIKRLAAPWTAQYRNYTVQKFGHGYEGGAGSWGEGSGHYDGLGWGTLLYRLEESDVPKANSSTPTSASATSSSTTYTTGAAQSTLTTSTSSRTSTATPYPSTANYGYDCA